MASTPKKWTPSRHRPESWGGAADVHPEPPSIADDDSLPDVMEKLARYLIKIIDISHTFDELRSSVFGHALSPLISYLSSDVHHQAILPALLALRGYFRELDEDDDRHLSLTRAYACEIVAWRFTTYLSEQEAIEYLLYELPDPSKEAKVHSDVEDSPQSSRTTTNGQHSEVSSERSRLLGPKRDSSRSPAISASVFGTLNEENEFALTAVSYAGLNALEIAIVCDAKKFLSQRAVQRIVHGMWRGDIIFWETVSVESKRKPRKYNKNRADPYCRLRVPKYLKVYELFFLAVFLALYYAVLVKRDMYHVTPEEILLMLWLAAFAYDELGQYIDAGLTLYTTDFWSIWDFGIVAIGLAFIILRIVGLAKHNYKTVDTAFDILALEGLLLLPRIASLLSLVPFFGVLIPCLKEMARFSTQFLGLVLIIYAGFATTFTLLARDKYTPRTMSYMLLKIFFGSSYLGFDNAHDISPLLGLPLMLIFVWLTNILLITCLISLISNKMSEIMQNAREEYLFQYSVYVLEASTSNRLTYYLPPLNLISLLFRPLRICVPASTLRAMRIIVLKITHAPHVALIQAFERLSAAATSQPSWLRIPSGPGDAHPRSTSGLGLSGRHVRSRSALSMRMSMKSPQLGRPSSTLRFSRGLDGVGIRLGVASPSPASKFRRQRDRERTYERLVEGENEDGGGEGNDNDDGNEHEHERYDDHGSTENARKGRDKEYVDLKVRWRRGRDGDGVGDEGDGKDDRIARLIEQVELLTEKVEDLVGVVAGVMERAGLQEEEDEGGNGDEHGEAADERQ